LFDFLNQIKGCECCIHADASWCFLSAKSFKKAFRSCPNPSENFPDFSGIYSHFFLSLFYLFNSSKFIFISSKYFIGLLMSQSVSRNFPGNFGIFWVFSVPLKFVWVPEFVLHWKIISKKTNYPILSNWAELVGPTHSTGPAALARRVHVASGHGQAGRAHGAAAAPFLGVRSRATSCPVPI
jgi:hypothetical protein